MFQPRQPITARPQKQRQCRHGNKLLVGGGQRGLLHWPTLVALAPGFLAVTMVERLVILSKRSLNATVTLRRFWVNLQVASVLTRKAMNVRMGKGKGGRKGVQARLVAGTVLVGFMALRPGQLRALCRRVRVRCNFPVSAEVSQTAWSLVSDTGLVGAVPTWISTRCLQRRYVTARFKQFQEELQKMRRPILWNYLAHLFFWRHVVPYASWAPSFHLRRRFRVRRRRTYRLRLVSWVRPQGSGFLRQIRFQIRLGWWRLQALKSGTWRYRHRQWQRALWSSQVFKQTSRLPWDLLLKARQTKRLLPHLYYASLRLSELANVAAPVALWYRLGQLASLAIQEPLGGFGLPLLCLQRLLLAQLTAVVLFWRWACCINRGVFFFRIEGQEPSLRQSRSR